MERSKYFNYTKPSQTQLNYTESSRSRSIIRRIDSACQMGIVEGFRVTVNSVDPTTIDIGAGTGYTGGRYRQVEADGDDAGERISTIATAASGGTVEGQGLADYTSGTINYVSLVYSEEESIPLAENFYPYTQRNTIISETFSVSVMTEANWNALSTPDLRERILVAKVTAQGAGTALSDENIQQVVQPKTHPTATQPSSITGVTVEYVSQETDIGNGTLRFTASDKKLYWTAPGDTEGTGVSIPSSGAYTVSSADTTYSLTLDVVYGALPSSDESDTIYIQSLYGQIIPRFSAEDTVHRDLVGSGTPTVNNPHGVSLSDIEGGGFDHADLFHKNGISIDADTTQLQCAINDADDSIDVTNLGGYSNQYLIDGNTYETLSGYDTGTDGRLYFDITPALDSGDYLIYVDSDNELQYVKIAEYTPADTADQDVLWSANIEILDMQNKTSGNGTLSWDATAETLTWEAPGDGATGDPVKLMANPNPVVLGHLGVYKIYSNDSDNWIIVNVAGFLGGGVASSTFDIDLNQTDQPLDGFLRLAIVTWNATGDIHYNLRDARNFRTSDIKEEFYEEHDENGLHTKILQQRLQVYDDTGPAVRALAPNNAVSASAETTAGGNFRAASDTGVYGYATSNYGIRGYAGDTYGGYFNADDAVGVYGSAHNTGAYFQAGGATGIEASVGGNTGAYLQASQTGLRVNATGGDVGAYISASSDTGVYVTAGGATAVEASASLYGGTFHASTYGIQGQAVGNYGVAGLAAHLAGYFIASKNDPATDIVGAYGQAENAGDNSRAVGVKGYVAGDSATGVFGTAKGAAGGIGVEGTGVYGVIGSGNVCGGSFTATGGAGAGVYGINTAAGAVGGSFEGSQWGVVGTADTGVYGVGSTGVYCDGLFDYNQGWVAAAGITSYVPILIQGNTYKLAIYT